MVRPIQLALGAAVLSVLALLVPVAAQELPRITIESAMPGVRVESVFVPGSPPDFEVPPGSVTPGYQRLRFTNYFSGTFDLDEYSQPEIWVLRMDELATYAWDTTANELILLLALRPNLAQMRKLPYLPLVNAEQVFHAQEQTMGFASGSGIRYIAYFSQSANPIEDNQLIYTYQGVTSDRQYYVTAQLPIAAKLPPPPPGLFDIEDPDFIPAYRVYLAEIVNRLQVTDPNAFTPPLPQLDATIQSLTIR